MSSWTSKVLTPTEVAALAKPIAEVHVLIYSLAPGNAEVQIRWPANAQVGMVGARGIQSDVISMAVSEIQKSGLALGG
jgi:hypothetical protein